MVIATAKRTLIINNDNTHDDGHDVSFSPTRATVVHSDAGEDEVKVVLQTAVTECKAL